MNSDARIMVFAKAPVAGTVKTRLIPALGAHGAAALHTTLTRHSIATAVNAPLCPVELWCSPDAHHPFFAQCQKDFGVTLQQQQGNNLGERMAQAFDTVLQQHPYAVVIGTDCPTLTTQDLRAALNALHEGFDAVIGPAEDGGYVLIGLRRS
ncbi:MAG: TIGR04282 family arsenosugar biosynthesis glycosyltransferase, partial [Gammaproteobacteria bacterium]